LGVGGECRQSASLLDVCFKARFAAFCCHHELIQVAVRTLESPEAAQLCHRLALDCLLPSRKRIRLLPRRHNHTFAGDSQSSNIPLNVMAEYAVRSCCCVHLRTCQHHSISVPADHHQHLHGRAHHGVLRNDSRHMDVRSTSTSSSCHTQLG
jgi:hypothetical protein